MRRPGGRTLAALRRAAPTRPDRGGLASCHESSGRHRARDDRAVLVAHRRRLPAGAAGTACAPHPADAGGADAARLVRKDRSRPRHRPRADRRPDGHASRRPEIDRGVRPSGRRRAAGRVPLRGPGRRPPQHGADRDRGGRGGAGRARLADRLQPGWRPGPRVRRRRLRDRLRRRQSHPADPPRRPARRHRARGSGHRRRRRQHRHAPLGAPQARRRGDDVGRDGPAPVADRAGLPGAPRRRALDADAAGGALGRRPAQPAADGSVHA